jgi:uncharacterized protein
MRPHEPKPKGPKKPRHPRRRRVTIALIVVAVIVALSLSGRVLGLYVDWLWFGEVGFRSVFWTRLWWHVLVGAAAFAAFFAIVYPNVELARRLAPSYRVTSSGDLLEPRSDRVKRWVGWGGLIACLLVALAAGVSASSSWQTFLLYFKQVSWGVKDPVFGHDVSFYVFSLPMWRGVQGFVFGALIVTLILTAIMHLIMGGIDFIAKPAPGQPNTPRGDPRFGGADPRTPFGAARGAAQIPQVDLKLGGRAVAHLSAVLAALFVVTGIGQLFRGWSLLYSTAGAVFGAGYTDVHIRLPLTYMVMGVAFVIGGLLIWNVWRRRQWWPLIAIGVWIVALVVFRGIIPGVYQSLIVNPNQLTKERAYIANNMAATKAAYKLKEIQQQPLSPKSPLTPAKLKANTATLQNIRLWDPNTLVTSYRQLQELRPYYSFLDADVDRYTVSGVYRETMLSARELNIDGLPTQAQTWVNQHITYTHGFGVAMSAVNQVTSDGSPDFLVQDVPPQSVSGLEIKQPRIYYGERGTGYSLVDTKDKEFDYPGPNGDVYANYRGTGGIPISSFLNRLAFCARLGTIKFFTTSSIGSNSKIIIRNAIQERISSAAPFLTLDHDPYMVIADGRLWWVQDAYTTTSRYPYSTPQSGVNYLRNSVKIVVDAYNGTMKFYVFDPSDPLLRTYQAAYPSLFTPKDQMPQALLDHLRYPEDLFNVQAEVYSSYHVDNPDVLYNKGDQWQIPDNVSLSGPGRMDAYYVIMSLPGSAKAEFLLMLPFVPNGRQNMIAWLGARSDMPSYGTALNYVFSSSYTVFGPSQVEATVNQDPTISSQRTLWGQQGSEVIMGNLLVTPIEDSLLYVQPLYLQSTQTQLPQLKRVIVFYRAPAPAGGQGNAQQVVAMEPTLGEALVAAFGAGFDSGNASGPSGAGTGTGGTGTGTGGTGTGGTGTGGPGGTGAGLTPQARALITQANQEFEAAQAALKAGDFAEYGRQIGLLQKTLGQLKVLP